MNLTTGRRILFALPCAVAAVMLFGLAAMADTTVAPNGLPIVTVHSTGGTVTIAASDDDNVRVQSPIPNLRIAHFAVPQGGRSRIMLPGAQRRLFGRQGWRTFQMPPRQVWVPNLNRPSDGISIENPGTDITVSVPKRTGALYINAEAGDVVIQKYRGPFLIVADGGAVRVANLVGRGIIRTISGNIDLVGIGGDIHIQTATGNIVGRGIFADRADVTSQGGSIDWRFARVGAGAYRFQSTDAPIRLSFRPGVAALVDAQSNGGSVQQTFDPSQAQVRFSNPHALSLAVNGGGSEITVTSMSGDITVEPVQP